MPEDKPLAFLSKTLSQENLKKSTYEKEMSLSRKQLKMENLLTRAPLHHENWSLEPSFWIGTMDAFQHLLSGCKLDKKMRPRRIVHMFLQRFRTSIHVRTWIVWRRGYSHNSYKDKVSGHITRTRFGFFNNPEDQDQQIKED